MQATEPKRNSFIAIFNFVFQRAVVYWVMLAVALLVLGGFLQIFGSASLFLHINTFHTPFLDYLFFFLTFLGDGIFNGVVTAYFLIRKQWQRGVFTGLVFALTGGVSAFLKKQIFADALRPKAFFEQQGVLIRTIDFVKVYSYNSFPSGHTITCVSIGLILALVVKQRVWQFVIAVLTIASCFSRIYLSQHFPIDVFAGAFIGLGLTVLSYLVLVFLPEKYSTQLLK